MFKIPKKINIFGKPHKITVIPNLTAYGTPVQGLLVLNDYHIYLEKNQKPEEMMHTLLHECGHAIIQRISLNQTGLPPEVEEVIVDSFATFMVETFNIRLKK